jgi:hypothetical protein
MHPKETMNRKLWHQLAALWRAEFLSPKDFLRRAAMLAIIFLAVHLAGLREYTCILNGTAGSVALSRGLSAFLGLTYVFAYLGFVLLVPILLLAAAMLVAWKRLSRGRESLAAEIDKGQSARM